MPRLILLLAVIAVIYILFQRTQSVIYLIPMLKLQLQSQLSSSSYPILLIFQFGECHSLDHYRPQHFSFGLAITLNIKVF